MGTFKSMSSMLKPNFHNCIGVILILYILSDTTIPEELFEVINEPMIKIVLVATCLYIIMHKPVVGCLALVAMYELMTRNSMNSMPSLAPSLVPSFFELSTHRKSDHKASNQMALNNHISYKQVSKGCGGCGGSKNKKPLDSNYESSNEKKNRIMSKFSANKKKISLEEDLVNNLVPYYNETIEPSSVQPILAKQPNKNSVRI